MGGEDLGAAGLSRQPAALAEAEITHRTVAQKLLALGLSRTSVNQTSREALTRFEIRAPIDGVVIEKHLAVGEAVGEDPRSS